MRVSTNVLALDAPRLRPTVELGEPGGQEKRKMPSGYRLLLLLLLPPLCGVQAFPVGVAARRCASARIDDDAAALPLPLLGLDRREGEDADACKSGGCGGGSGCRCCTASCSTRRRSRRFSPSKSSIRRISGSGPVAAVAVDGIPSDIVAVVAVVDSCTMTVRFLYDDDEGRWLWEPPPFRGMPACMCFVRME